MNIGLEKQLRVPFRMGILDISIDPITQSLYAACMDGIYRYPLKTPEGKPHEGSQGTPVRIGGHSSYVSGVKISPKNSKLISTSYDGTLGLRSLEDCEAKTDEAQPDVAPMSLEKIHSFWSWRMALSPDEKYIASVSGQYLAGSEDYSPLPSPEPTVKVLETATGKVVSAMNMLPSVQCVAIDPTSRFVAAGNLVGDLAVWEIETGKELAAWRTPTFSSWGIIKSHCYIGGIYAVSFSRDSQCLYAAGMGDMRDPMAGNGKQKWQKFDWHKNPVEKVSESKDDEAGGGLMETLAWHPSGDYFAMAGRLQGGNWNVALFSAESGELIGQAKTGMRITSAAFSEDGASLFLAGMQGQPEPKDGEFPSFGYMERYSLQIK